MVGFVILSKAYQVLVYIGCFTVINKFNTTYSCHIFHPMFQALKILHRISDLFFSYIHCDSRKTCCHSIILIMLSLSMQNHKHSLS